MITVEEALSTIIAETEVLGTETLNLISSLNRVLAEDIYSKDNLPPFDKSAMDGYAIKSKDTEGCSTEKPARLKVKGVIKAGDLYEEELHSKEAIKIMTGAPLPRGADTVIQVEKVKEFSNEITIIEPIGREKNILKMGEEIRNGELAIPLGKKIRPAEIGLLASLGYSKIKVHKIPKIILLTTGDELIDIEEKLTPGKIRNCNEYSLLALAKNLGAEVKSYGVIRDDPDLIFEKIEEAFEEGDIVISSGGASVGDYDFIHDSLKKLKVDTKFEAVAIKPGKPVTFAKFKNKLYFALPGNPLSVINTFEQFVSPAIKRMMGIDEVNTDEFPVILAEDFKVKKGRDNYVYVDIRKENGAYYAYKTGSQGSNQLLTISKANGIIIIDKDTSIARAGEILNGRFIFK